ncbi:MAG: hypothetical protein M3R31_08430 [Pseudomonadota bacterium]|nr:hypothetical protein [Pseudomonadota bacterium]
MNWISRLRASGEAEPADPWDKTAINGGPYDPKKTIRSSPENPAAPGNSSDAQIAKEIKRRQLSLAVRYVAAVRAR